VDQEVLLKNVPMNFAVQKELIEAIDSTKDILYFDDVTIKTNDE